MATAPVELKETNFLHELDEVTKDIIKEISSAQSSGNVSIGDLISVPHTTFLVMFSRKISLAELKRLRTQFIKISKVNPPVKVDVEAIAHSFVDYINSTI